MLGCELLPTVQRLRARESGCLASFSRCFQLGFQLEASRLGRATHAECPPSFPASSWRLWSSSSSPSLGFQTLPWTSEPFLCASFGCLLTSCRMDGLDVDGRTAHGPGWVGITCVDSSPGLAVRWDWGDRRKMHCPDNCTTLRTRVLYRPRHLN